jgi:predicted metal-dependent phosphoesterase TrpH
MLNQQKKGGTCMANTVDLHLHTTFSDGIFSVEEIVLQCVNARLNTISITDHDTVDHIAPAMNAGVKHGIRVIPGLELSCDYFGKSLHLLCYQLAHRERVITELLDAQRISRIERIKEMALRIEDLGFSVDLQKLLQKQEGTLGRPEISRMVVDDPRNASLLKEKDISGHVAFLQNYLVHGKAAYVERKKISAVEAIGKIHDAYGIAVWAHPLYTVNFDSGQLSSIILNLSENGLDGVEVFYATNTAEETERLHGHAQRLNLIETAGSDFHGPGHVLFPTVGYYNTWGLDFVLNPRL